MNKPLENMTLSEFLTVPEWEPPPTSKMIKPISDFSLEYILKSKSKTFGIIFDNKNQKGKFLEKLKSQNLEYKISHFAGSVFELRILDKIVIEFKRSISIGSICGYRVEELFINFKESDNREFRNFIKSIISVRYPLT